MSTIQPNVQKNEEDTKKWETREYYISFVLGILILISFFVWVVVSAYFCGLCQSITTPYILYFMLSLGVILILFPFVRKIRVGNFLELEKNIQETRKEIDDFRGEVRNIFSVISNINSAQASVKNYNYIVDFKERKAALDSENSIVNQYPEIIPSSEEIQEEYNKTDREDYILSLARTRIEIEKRLRQIMGKRLKGENLDHVRFMSLNKLVRLFIQKYKIDENLESSFEYVIKISNAAIHAQPVSKEQAEEVIALGTKLISFLENIGMKDSDSEI